MNVKVDCTNCNKEFQIKKSNLKAKYHSCSKECEKKNISKNLTKGEYFKCTNDKCENVVYRKQSEIKKNKEKRFFCSHKCSAVINNLGYNKHHPDGKMLDRYERCVVCGSTDKVVPTARFCGHKCHSKFVYDEWIKKWLNGKENGVSGIMRTSTRIRRYMFEKHNSKCEKCGWGEVNVKTGKSPLQLNHIDGNWENNKIENLQLLCPNCHSLTHNFGALNYGNGRVARKLNDRKTYAKLKTI